VRTDARPAPPLRRLQYTHVFTIDRVLLPYGINISSWYPPSFEFAYQTAWQEAAAMNAPGEGRRKGQSIRVAAYTVRSALLPTSLLACCAMRCSLRHGVWHVARR